MSNVDEFKRLMATRYPTKSEERQRFLDALQLIKNFTDDELVTVYIEFRQISFAQDVKCSSTVAFLSTVIIALADSRGLRQQVDSSRSSIVNNMLASLNVQTLQIAGKSFKVFKGGQKKIGIGDRNRFRHSHIGVYIDLRRNSIECELSHFITANYGFGLQIVALAKRRDGAEKWSHLTHFALASFTTTDEIWADIFEEFQNLYKSYPIELPPVFYEKLVADGKIT